MSAAIHYRYYLPTFVTAQYQRGAETMGIYSRKNTSPEGPGRWVTGDGEYEIYRGHRPGYASSVWYVNHRAHWTGTTYVSREIGHAPTLNAALALAARHHVHPVVPVDTWPYPSVDA